MAHEASPRFRKAIAESWGGPAKCALALGQRRVTVRDVRGFLSSHGYRTRAIGVNKIMLGALVRGIAVACWQKGDLKQAKNQPIYRVVCLDRSLIPARLRIRERTSEEEKAVRLYRLKLHAAELADKAERRARWSRQVNS